MMMVMLRLEKRPFSALRGLPLAVPSSLYPRYFSIPGMMSVPCRAELFWSGSHRLLGPFSAAGAAGPDVTALEAQWGPMGVQEEEAPAGGKHLP